MAPPIVELRDVTKRREAEDALRLSEERLSLALESGSDGFWDWDIDTGKVQVSDHWFSTLGYDPRDMKPDIRQLEALIHPDDVDRSRRHLIEHLKGVSPTFECEYRLKTKTGAFGWSLASSFASGIPFNAFSNPSMKRFNSSSV